MFCTPLQTRLQNTRWEEGHVLRSNISVT